MKQRLLIIGLDCIGAEVLSPSSLSELLCLRGLVERGISGPLESTLPPITVPAWTSMLSGRDPGELGIYGFRNRRSFAYGDLVYASSNFVRYRRLWDYVGEAGGQSIVVGVPQTSPPPSIRGCLVAGFEAHRSEGSFTYPDALASELQDVVRGEYQFDVDDFRNVPREDVLQQVYRMTEDRLRVMCYLMKKKPWDFAMLCEIGPDRLHHCFWSDHDPGHPRHNSGSPHRETIRRYYRYLDENLGRLLNEAGAGTTVLIASDHGAKAMHGGICINEVLREAGWLKLKHVPEGPAPLTPDLVDWPRTRAWAEGGYYGRVFLNIKGREPNGTIPMDQRDDARSQLTALFKSLELPGGPTIYNHSVWPEKTYRRVRGIAPDLLIFFGDLSWRSLGSIGHRGIWLIGNDTGPDEANHAQDGMFVLTGPGVRQRGYRRASILDIAPTALALMGLNALPDLSGRNLLERGWAE
jgi:predicted AlkP superfamily phosphohydrolase/phosphomutase